MSLELAGTGPERFKPAWDPENICLSLRAGKPSLIRWIQLFIGTHRGVGGRGVKGPYPPYKGPMSYDSRLNQAGQESKVHDSSCLGNGSWIPGRSTLNFPPASKTRS